MVVLSGASKAVEVIGYEGVLGVCGGFSRVVAEVVTNPLNVAKTMVQQPNGPQLLVSSVRREPVRTLSRGIGSQLVSAPLVGAGTFYALETTRAKLSINDFCGDALAAAVGTLVSIGISQPFSVINDSVLSNRQPNFVAAIANTPPSRLVSPRVYAAIALSKVPNNSLMWASSEFLRKNFDLPNALNGALAAFFAVCLTAPLDTVKVRFTTSTNKHHNPILALRTIARDEGAIALVRAAPARCLQVVPMYAIQFHTYQALKANLQTALNQDLPSARPASPR